MTLKMQCTPALLAAHPTLHPFPATSFTDWDQARALAETLRYNATGSTILASWNPHAFNRDDRGRRRLYARGLLAHHFGDRADFTLTDQAGFWRRMAAALCVVHIHGAWVGSLDRSHMQCFALGGLLLTHPIASCLGDRPPAPWSEFVPLEHPELYDVPEKVTWIERHREEARAIAARGQERFWTEADPVALWSGIRSRVTA
jgi:hypothetical protein